MIIPSEAEGSRGASFKLTPRDPSTVARDYVLNTYSRTRSNKNWHQR